MEEKKKVNYGLIIFIAIVVVLFIPIIVDYVGKQNISVLSSKDITEKMNAKESFIVYIGDADKSTKSGLRSVRDLAKTDYAIDYSVYTVKSSDDVKKTLGDKVEVAVIVEGDIQITYAKYDEKNITNDANIYYLGNITDKNRTYKVAENFKAYKKLVKSDKTTMAVFGRDNCFYCNKFKPVYNAVSEKYNVDIYFFDSLSYDETEYEKITNMDLTVPAKCSSEGKEYKLSDGFGTPLTLFTKKGKVVDCISGYVNRSSLIDKLKTNNMISE